MLKRPHAEGGKEVEIFSIAILKYPFGLEKSYWCLWISKYVNMPHKDCFKLLQHTSAHLGEAGHPQTKSLSIRKQSASSFCPAKQQQKLVTHYLYRSPSVLEEPYHLSILPAATSTTQYWALYQARAYHRTKHVLLRDPISHPTPKCCTCGWKVSCKTSHFCGFAY